MQKSDSVQSIKVVRRQVQPSTTLNRKYVTPPKAAARRVQVSVNAAPTAATAATKPAPKVAAPAPQKVAAVRKPATTQKPATTTEAKLTPEQLKELAIKKALRTATEEPEPATRPNKLHFGFGRILLACVCTVAAVFAIGYFINQNVFNLSIANAARSAGLEVTNSPKVPSGYELTDITSEEGKLTLKYVNHSAKTEFTIIEERSSWDSNALLSNFVKPNYGVDCTVVREQGITIYISDSNASWINGRIVHKIIAEPGTLTKKQIRSIATSF